MCRRRSTSGANTSQPRRSLSDELLPPEISGRVIDRLALLSKKAASESITPPTPTFMESSLSNPVCKKASIPRSHDVKERLRRGQVREDGKVFWQYTRGGLGQRWVSREGFEKLTDFNRNYLRSYKSEKRKNRDPRVLKRGDTNREGLIFWCYDVGYSNSERWVTAEQFQDLKERKLSATRSRRSKAKSPENKPLRMGDRRSDGKVFVVYDKTCRGGEWWVEPEKLREVVRSRRKWKNARYSSDPQYKLSVGVRNKINATLKKQGFLKKETTKKILGCSVADLKSYLEARFLPGMSWSNRSKWHIDHIVPLVLARTREEILSLNHFSNLRPLWGTDNLIKGERLPDRNLIPVNVTREILRIYERGFNK